MSTSIRTVVDDYLWSNQHSLTSKTHRWYTQKLGVFVDWCEQANLTLEHIKARTVSEFLSSLPQELSSYTKHGYAQVIKGFLRWCADDEDLGVTERSVKKIEMPKVEVSEIEIFTPLQLKALLKACNKMPYPARDRAILSILIDTGIRVSELAFDATRPNETTGLRLENVFLELHDSYLKVMGKGRKEREVGLGEQSRVALRRYITRYRGKSQSPFVFLSRTGEPLTVRGVEQIITNVGEIARVERCYPHRFRHTFAVSYLVDGGSDLKLMKLLGHTSLHATQVYVRTMSRLQARNGQSVLDNLF